jgi:ABC-2 type transport system permease protein
VLVDLVAYGTLKYLYFHNWDIAITLFLLAPLACLLGVGYNILISSRMNDVRTAQQLGMLILIPFSAIYLLSELQVMTLTTDNMLLMAAVLVVVDIVVFYLVKATFQREEILAKWKWWVLSNPVAEYPAACCEDASGLVPLPWEEKIKMRCSII